MIVRVDLLNAIITHVFHPYTSLLRPTRSRVHGGKSGGELMSGGIVIHNPRPGTLENLKAQPAGFAPSVYLEGRERAGDGGEGLFIWESGDQRTNVAADPTAGVYVPPNSDPRGASGCWIRAESSHGEFRPQWFASIDRETRDATTAIQAALTVAKRVAGTVRIPAGTYKVTAPLSIDAGAIIGDGWGTETNAPGTVLIFYNCTDSMSGAINTRITTARSNFIRIENLYVKSSSWDGTTGAIGHGVDIEAPVIMRNVLVQGFKEYAVFLHNDANGVGPYGSLLENVITQYAGKHGIVNGTGANAITFLNCQAKWCGAPAYLTAPTVAGSYDGFFVARDGDGNPGTAYFTYAPENIHILGGDCSYNSRFGWNFDQTENSTVFPGYAEGNLEGAGKQARVGNVVSCAINFTQLKGSEEAIQNDLSFSLYYAGTRIRYGGKTIGPADWYDFIANPVALDNDGKAWENAPKRKLFISRDNAFTSSVYLDQQAAPDGATINSATEAAATICGAGTFHIGLGAGSRHAKFGNGYFRLPDIYLQAIATGWNASAVQRAIGTASPTSDTWSQGDIQYNRTPAVGKPYAWACTTGGTPGSWVPVYRLPGVSADRGDTDVTLVVGTDAPTQLFNTALTRNRVITLSPTGAVNGDKFRIVRKGLGAFTMDVGGLKTIPASTAAFVDVEFNGGSWILTGYGTL
ncbi:MAG TPA: glycosyl hydrolase family 28-related protein [Gemmatimonadaceae bacterium]